MIDNARYLGVEHRHKEKEYGIKWRTAFKEELKKVYNVLVAKYGNPLAPPSEFDTIGSAAEDKNVDHLEVILAIVEKDYKDTVTFKNGKQYELIDLLKENLNNFDRQC